MPKKTKRLTAKKPKVEKKPVQIPRRGNSYSTREMRANDGYNASLVVDWKNPVE